MTSAPFASAERIAYTDGILTIQSDTSPVVLPINAELGITSATAIQALSPSGRISSTEGARSPAANCLTISSEAQTIWSARVHLSRGPAPLFLSSKVGSRIFAIVVNPLVALSPTCSLYTLFAKAQPSRFTSSLFVQSTMISASLIPARNNESRERASPVTNKQSRDWDSLIASGSGSINATCRLSSLRAAATPLPTSPAPAIMTRILHPSLSRAPIILTY